MGADDNSGSVKLSTEADVEQEDPADTKSDEYSLPFLQACLFVSAIEDTIAELQILAECNNELRVIRTHSDMHTLLAVKYGVEQVARTDELDGIDHKNLGTDENKLNKLDADRKLTRDTFVSTYKCLSLESGYRALARRVADLDGAIQYRAALVVDEERHRLERRDLSRALRSQRNHVKTVTYDTGVEIDTLRNTLEDCLLNAEIRSRYVDNYQQARTEMHHQDLMNQEAEYSVSVEYYKTRADHEQRVHSEIELLVTIIINETLERVESWMDKYDKDIEKLDLTIQLKKNEYYDQVAKREGLEATIESHKQKMAEWQEFKDAREKLRLYREKMTNAAIAVQAWWRGLMVRQQLGPYKPKKKKGDKKKK